MAMTRMPHGKYNVGDQVSGKTLIEYAGRNKFDHHMWMWICNTCEQTHGPTAVGKLTKTQRCSQCAIEYNRLNNKGRWTGTGEISGTHIKRIKDAASLRNLDYSITPEYMWALFLNQNRKCAYTKIELSFGYRKSTASLDRIDNSLGYVEGNVQWVHTMINRMKSDLSEQEFFSICEAVSNHTLSTSSKV